MTPVVRAGFLVKISNFIKTVIVFVLATLIVGVFFLYSHRMIGNSTVITIGGVGVEIELAQTPRERERGLSQREKLAENQGMLFVFDKPDLHSFWTKEMEFPIDIIWIGENRNIVDIARNATPESFPQTFLPKSPALYVLEVNADWTTKNNIMIGASVSFSNGLSK